MFQNIRKQKPVQNKKIKDSVSSLWDNFKCSNIHMIMVLEGKEKEEEIGNLVEKILKEKFP